MSEGGSNDEDHLHPFLPTVTLQKGFAEVRSAESRPVKDTTDSLELLHTIRSGGLDNNARLRVCQNGSHASHLGMDMERFGLGCGPDERPVFVVP